jgi:hypothetical protein
MATLIEDIQSLGENEHLTCRCMDGRRVAGTTEGVERDQAGVRIELCETEGEVPTYRIHLDRSTTDWNPPYVERREGAKWVRYGELVNLE